jgi:chromate reductase
MSSILALAASYRDRSLNKQLLAIAVAEARRLGAEVTELDYASIEAPIYRGEEKVSKLPKGAAEFSAALRSHDCLMLASPEYNWSIPGGLKNIIDWLSVDTSAPLVDKTVLLMCATTSGRAGTSGLQHLRVTLEGLRMWVYPQSIGIGRAHEQLKDGILAQESDRAHLAFCVEDFIRASKGLVSHA